MITASQVAGGWVGNARLANAELNLSRFLEIAARLRDKAPKGDSTGALVGGDKFGIHWSFQDVSVVCQRANLEQKTEVSAFMDTDAVVRDDSIARGMKRMLAGELPWSDERKRRQRQVVCWYQRMSLNVKKAAEEKLAVLQAHLDALELAPRLVL